MTGNICGPLPWCVLCNNPDVRYLSEKKEKMEGTLLSFTTVTERNDRGNTPVIRSLLPVWNCTLHGVGDVSTNMENVHI